MIAAAWAVSLLAGNCMPSRIVSFAYNRRCRNGVEWLGNGFQEFPDDQEIILQTQEEVIGTGGEEYAGNEIAIPIDDANLIATIDQATTSASKRSRKSGGNSRKVQLSTAQPHGRARKWEQKQVQIKTLEGEFQVSVCVQFVRALSWSRE